MAKSLRFILLGAITNIAVACGCAVIFQLRDDQSVWHYLPFDTMSQMLSRWGAAPHNLGRGFGGTQHGRGIDRSRIHFMIDYEDWTDEDILVVASGWPLRSLDALAYPQAQPPSSAVLKFGAADVLIPWRPLWSGFAIDTIFYAAIISGGWLLFAAPGVLRRRIRAHRGLCTACGYDLRGRASENKLCPECGLSASKPS